MRATPARTPRRTRALAAFPTRPASPSRGAPDLVLTADGGSGAVSVFARADVRAGGRHSNASKVTQE